MKPILTYHLGFHDSSITIYEPDTDKMSVFEFDRIIGVKNSLFSVPFSIEKDYMFCQDRVLELFGSNEFSYVFIKLNQTNSAGESPYRIERELAVSDFTNKLVIENEIEIGEINHHDAHAWCGYGQSGFDNAFVIAYDGGGDDTHFRTSTFRNKKQTNATNYGYRISYFYRNNAYALDEVYAENRVGYSLSLAGKVMGLSAYGNPKPRDVRSLVDRNRDFHKHHGHEETCNGYRNMSQHVFGLGDHRFGAYNIGHFFDLIKLRKSITGSDQYRVAATLQAS